MKRSIYIVVITFLHLLTLYSKDIADKIVEIPFNSENGIKVETTFSGNYGVVDFDLINGERVGVLSNSENCINIYSREGGALVDKIELGVRGKRFTYGDSQFYIVSGYKIFIYSISGKFVGSFNISKDFRFIKSLTFQDSNLYLYTHEGYTYKLIDSGKTLSINDQLNSETKGWFDGEISYLSKKIDRDWYEITIDGRSYRVKSDNPLGSVEVVGRRGSDIYLNIESIVAEKPLKTRREIALFSEINRSITDRINYPNSYYLNINSDIKLIDDELLSLVSTESSLSFYRLNSKGKGGLLPFSDTLLKLNYHCNYNLPKLDTISDPVTSYRSIPKDITRDMIVEDGDLYEKVEWYCNDENTTNHQAININGATIRTPAWVVVGDKVKMPYKWGGFTHIEGFNQHIIDGKYAGDDYTTTSSMGDQYVVGVDCSGFVSRVWQIPSKQSTRTLPNFSSELPSWEITQKGDIANLYGVHVMLIVGTNPSGTLNILHASGGSWDVNYDSSNFTQLTNFIPRKLNTLNENLVVSQHISDYQISDEVITVDLSEHFETVNGDPIEYSLDYISDNQFLNIELNGEILTFSINQQSDLSEAGVRVKASSNGEENYSFFTVFKTPSYKPKAGFGGSYRFSGNDYVVMEGSEPFNNLSNISISVWVKLDELNNSMDIVGKTYTTNRGWYLQTSPNNMVKFYIKGEDGSSRKVYSETALQNGKWYNITATYSGSSQKIFIDGILDGTTEYSEIVDIESCDQELKFGSSTGSGLKGSLDEISIWDIPLNHQDILENLHRRGGVCEEDLLGYWDFDEGCGSTLKNGVCGIDGEFLNIDFGSWSSEGAPVTYLIDFDQNQFDSFLPFNHYDNSVTFDIVDDNCSLGELVLEDSETGEFSYQITDFQEGEDQISYKIITDEGSSDEALVRIVLFDELVAIEESVSVKSLKLMKNYPNPFNPETTISFELSEPLAIDFTIYNSSGKVVSNLVRQNFDKGRHSLLFDGVNLSSGIYFYQLKAKDQTDIGRMVLLK